MTSTQVRYWTLQEDKRHNLASERLDASKIAETMRHNVVSEKQENFRLKEVKRHNIVSEKLTASDIMEKIRHNKESEKLTATQLAEIQRHNYAQESIDRERNAIGRAQLVIDREKLANEIVKTNEGVRHNKAMEGIDKAYKEAQAALATANTEKAYQDIEYRFWDTLTAMFGGLAKSAGSFASIAAM
jgi:hypothetical protein